MGETALYHAVAVTALFERGERRGQRASGIERRDDNREPHGRHRFLAHLMAIGNSARRARPTCMAIIPGLNTALKGVPDPALKYSRSPSPTEQGCSTLLDGLTESALQHRGAK